MDHSPSTPHAEHKSPNYILIFVWLIVITAAEIALGYATAIPIAISYPILLAMAGVKALLVVLYFMHLRYDSRWFLLSLMVAMPLSVLFILALVLGYVRK